MATATQTPRRAPQRASATSATRDAALPAVAAGTDLDAELVPRFLNLLIPAVTTLAGQFAPQIGSAIGDLIGGKEGSQVGGQVGGIISGLFGGRALPGPVVDASVVDVEVSRALQQYQLTQVVAELTQKCTPAIVDAMRQTVQERTSRGESGDVDDEAMERGWGFLASVIADQVVKFAPDAIKFATKALGGVIGSRDVDQYAPLLVDTETTQRFVLPSLSAIMAGVQGCLPQLFSLLTSDREIPRDTGISWQDLTTTKRLWDNDNIAVLQMVPIDNPDEIEFVLELAPHKTWWKGIQVQDDNGSFIAEIGVQDRTKVASVRVNAQQLLSPGGYLLFMKAKFLGIHTGMYRLATGGLTQLKGQRVHFYWYAD